MRLMHTESFELRSFTGPPTNAPPYAILSHTWEDDEVLFQDVATPERMVKDAFAKGGWCVSPAWGELVLRGHGG